MWKFQVKPLLQHFRSWISIAMCTYSFQTARISFVFSLSMTFYEMMIFLFFFFLIQKKKKLFVQWYQSTTLSLCILLLISRKVWFQLQKKKVFGNFNSRSLHSHILFFKRCLGVNRKSYAVFIVCLCMRVMLGISKSHII